MMTKPVFESLPAALTADVVVVAPTGRDAPLTRQLLEDIGLRVRVCDTIADACAHIDETSGVLLVAEEAFDRASREALLEALKRQPTWSDIPIIVLTGEGELSRAIPGALREIAASANVTLIERPVRIATLTTAVRSALRARLRQLDLRAYLIERLAAEKELRRAQQEAETANLAKSNFLTTMSHELRTPLNAIGGYTELLKLGIPGPVNERQLHQLDRIEKSERHLLALINDVLNFAKIEAGHLKLDARTVNLSALVDELETFIEPQLQTKELRYFEDIEPSLLVHTDSEKVRQILLNLLSNAIKFTGRGGEIRVVAKRANGKIRISVIDNGEGIPSDKLEAIFEPFVQVGRSFNAPSEGTGLGLAISRDLAKLLGGDLKCQSELGAGSTFTLELPAKH
jgi:signal transduction histidine kinase